MATTGDLDAYRQQVFEALRAAGHPVDAWQDDYERNLAAYSTAKWTPIPRETGQ